ncbi:GCN5-related N-acetyltransferase [Anaeromyxobacter dehalogenans 2CP-1]|uniref:GCN5-related N-acetyltransferase n=1 Tax=Anaeromyxobacter dehalogenans (strain ATCC BAA-258 / DSM 21875 / 2CP-1) TaxID=455488 RepID=B8JD33_ANAD2|nr:GNAT family N-acetyltransferase [Anaeromyxobacter dehalogenans]ACL64061.1 GCN5-related N-acetyltransferase [Anaeromyxobacter dehalogenans 2CP-1]
MTPVHGTQGAGPGDELAPLDGPRLRAVAATRAHAAQIQSCFQGAPDYFVRTEGGPAGADAAERLLAEAEADPERRVYALVPHTGGPAVGVLDLYLNHPEPGTAHVGLLLFREACQGLGYGKETTAALEHVLARSGFRALRLSVGDENPGARAFWERLGFAEVGRLDRGIAVFEKPLEPA